MILFQGCIFVRPFHLQISASAEHWTLHWLFANFRFSYTLNLPLVVCRFPLQLNIEPSTGCLQISASAIHWTFHWLFADFHFSLILNLPLVVCLRPPGSALRAPPFGLRPQRLRRCAPAALHESKECLQLLPDSASSKHWNLHWSMADFHFN